MKGKSFKPVFGTGFMQVCNVVNSVDDSIKKMYNELGIGPWNVVEVKIDTITQVLLHGRPGKFGFKVGLAQMGDVEVELIEPIEGDSIYAEFLKEKGEGVHHFGCPALDSFETYKQTIEDMERSGYPCVMSGRCPPGYFAYFDTTMVLNAYVEFHWPDPEGYTPPFDYTYPEK